MFRFRPKASSPTTCTPGTPCSASRTENGRSASSCLLVTTALLPGTASSTLGRVPVMVTTGRDVAAAGLPCALASWLQHSRLAARARGVKGKSVWAHRMGVAMERVRGLPKLFAGLPCKQPHAPGQTSRPRRIDNPPAPTGRGPLAVPAFFQAVSNKACSRA